ncbi:pyridoxine 4-dehydrogenase [Spathaspora passalidarum NRRL Y-27907]|uniref:Pyridoxine 4-dehydrogenase n=1 Tax=Spathaspora passalidarum (strain NRRL Y-27907 / 11-Y1) TaxID=619300 RepID=G3AJ53_SPAPN|nr:pyridoxine 4-dehydrogenase [Spathaspora passalidarum NRRL Y-27907]EGW33810.1 pyridoxine 4-dehydrogenase [Spathaspora passalidarum NRRL Y-27907]
MSYTAVNIPGRFGFGTMSMTWKPVPPPTAQSIETLKFVTSHKEFGTKLLNGGEFYGPDDANLKLFKEFLDSNDPEANKELIVSIKGGVGPDLRPDGGRESIKRSIENIASYFPKENRPKLIFEIARVDTSIPYEETVGHIAEFVKNGTIDGISLSEVGIESIRKAITVFPISCVELELNLFSPEVINTGILKELSAHQIPLIAYSPLCRGLLTDYCVEHADTFLDEIPEGDFRLYLDKFQPDNFKHNLVALKKLYDYAHNVKKTTLETLALSWILKISGKENFKGIPKVTHILPIPSGSTTARVTSNFSNFIELTDEDLQAIDKIFEENPIRGLRYNEHLEDSLMQ